MKKDFLAVALAMALVSSMAACGVAENEAALASTAVNETLVLASTELKAAAGTASESATAAVVTAETAVNDAAEAEDVTYVTLSGSTATSEGNGKVKVDEDGTVKLKTAGTYVISGELKGQLIASVDDGDVTLVLNGVTITSETSAALYVKNVTNCTVILAEGTKNVLTDAGKYVYELNEDGTLEDDPNACIHVKGNLVIGGTGSLTVNANQADGIKSKLAMTVIGGNITVISAEDAIQCNTDLVIAGGTLNITSGGGTTAAKSSQNSMNFGWGRNMTASTTSSEDDVSTKGIKGENSVTITGGEINVNACDDAIHSNGTVAVYGGEMTLATGDDGLHADTAVIIEDGEINITKSYEGIEAADIVINGGNVNVTASDDGLNAADGSGTETMGGGRMFGGFGSTASYDFSVTVTGGTLYVNAGGDGLDSNGTLVISGGNVFVDGPVDNGNTAVDSEASAVINGGNLVAVGSSGMLETPSSGSSQNVLVVMFNETKQAGTEITVKDASGKVLLTHTTAKSAVCAILSSEAFESNGKYTVTVGNNSFEVTLTSSVMTVNTSGTAVNAGGFGMGGQMGGQQGGFGGRMNGQMPEMNGEQGRMNGQMPEMPEGGFNGQAPEMPEGGFNGQAPDMNGEGFGKNGRMPWMRDGQMPEGQVPEGTPEQ